LVRQIVAEPGYYLTQEKKLGYDNGLLQDVTLMMALSAYVAKKALQHNTQKMVM
jgi:hypothetical protein